MDNLNFLCFIAELYIPGGGNGIKVHEQPACAVQIHDSMNACFSKYGLEPDMFLVNITHDRRNFMGTADKAKQLCGWVRSRY